MERKDELFFSHIYEKTSDFSFDFLNKGITSEDLDQERALMIIEYIHEKKHLDKSDEDVMDEIRGIYSEKIKDLIAQNESQTDVSNKILKRVNKVNDAAIRYKEEFFIKPTPKELAEYLGVTEGYILDTVQMSGYEISDIDFEPETKEKKGP